MMKEENILRKRYGKENHFQVPEGYFDKLTEQVMANLPEQEARIISIEEHSLWQRMPWRKIAATIAAVGLLGGGALVAVQQQPAQRSIALDKHQTVKPAAGTDDAAFYEMANYTMMDNETIYASLIAEN